MSLSGTNLTGPSLSWRRICALGNDLLNEGRPKKERKFHMKLLKKESQESAAAPNRAAEKMPRFQIVKLEERIAPKGGHHKK